MSLGLKSKVNIIWQDPQSHMFAKYHTFVQAFTLFIHNTYSCVIVEILSYTP